MEKKRTVGIILWVLKKYFQWFHIMFPAYYINYPINPKNWNMCKELIKKSYTTFKNIDNLFLK